MEEWMLGTMGQLKMSIDTTSILMRGSTALAQWMAVMILVSVLKKRFGKGKTIALAFLSLLLLLVYTEGVIFISHQLWFPSLIGGLALMIGTLLLICDIDGREAAYFGMLAFMISEFAAALMWQLFGFRWGEEDTYFVAIGMGLMAVIFLLVFFICHVILKKYIVVDQSYEFSKWELATQWGISIVVFLMSNINFISLNTSFSQQNMNDFRNARTMETLLGVVFLFAHLVNCERLRMGRELDNVHNLLKNQYDQYKLSRDSIDMINYKYHDLKHQIAFLRSEEDPGKRAEFLNKLEADIKAYELQNKTGNEVLDTILTGKGLYGSRHGITMTCVADGTLLEFMDTMDICSIFGNAMDNAMECELKIPDKEKRLIHVTVSKQRKFILIRFENYYESEIKVSRGRLMTTKNQKEFHGYGIKSIRYTVEKYGGAVNISTDNNWFDMKILIPIKEDSKPENNLI